MGKVVLPDAEWLASLATNPAYKGIDIARELAKIDNWFALPKNAKRVKSRAFILNWLNKVDVAVEGSVDQPHMSPVNRAVATRALDRSSDQARAGFVKLLLTLASVFRAEVDDLLLEAYWEALRTWPPEALEAGARRLIATHIHFPRPAEWAEEARVWTQEQRAKWRQKRRALVQSTEPPLKAAEVRKLVKDLAVRLSL